MPRLNETELHMLELANKLDALEPAARSMLAALVEYRRCGLRNEAADAAIAAAEAAGIKAAPADPFTTGQARNGVAP